MNKIKIELTEAQSLMVLNSLTNYKFSLKHGSDKRLMESIIEIFRNSIIEYFKDKKDE